MNLLKGEPFNLKCLPFFKKKKNKLYLQYIFSKLERKSIDIE